MADWPDAVLQECRIVDLWGDVSEDECRRVNRELLAHTMDDPRAGITFIICSAGGSCADGWGIIDAMQGLSCPIHTVAVGTVRSMAAMIFVAGDRRACLQNADLMFHEFIVSRRGAYSQIVADRVVEEQEYERFIRHLIRHSRHDTKEDVTRHLLRPNGDTWLTAQQAMEHGLVEEIWDAVKVPLRERK